MDGLKACCRHSNKIFRYQNWHSLFAFPPMNTLFPTAPVLPPGFLYDPDFISQKEEAALLEIIEGIEVHPFQVQGYEARRKVASFGYDWSFEKQQLSKGKEIPKAFDPLIEKLAARLALPKDHFAELLVTEYPVGAVINWHRDAPPFDLIAGISLLGDCVFRLRPYEKQTQGRRPIISLPVQRRSLYVMQGTARTDWQHSTQPVKEVRYSITLRSLRHRH